MGSWHDLLTELESQPESERAAWTDRRIREALGQVRALRHSRNVIYYASAFLQKPVGVPAPWLQITAEDLNGFMSAIHGMDCAEGLTLLLHTPGGVTNATESIVAYLFSKFTSIEVIVPTFAMSAGTMIALASDRIVMGRQSQLGPIDPQLPVGGSFVSAGAIVNQFSQAHKEILQNRDAAHVWAPILQSLGPALLTEAQDALVYGERMVGRWLSMRMFAGETDRDKKAKRTAKYFSDKGTHKSHGRRIDRDDARAHDVVVEDLEESQALQEAVLTAYHLFTILFEKSPTTKIVVTHQGKAWMKNFINRS